MLSRSRRLFILVLAAASISPAFGAEAVDPDVALNDTWFRVYEKCGTPLETVPDFSEGGGDALVGRRMILTIDGDKFTATTYLSLRCGQKEPVQRHADDSQVVDCVPQSVNRGTVSRNGSALRLDATERSPGNNWGDGFNDWSFRFIGSVLELSHTQFSGNCGFVPFYIYWIRYPGS